MIICAGLMRTGLKALHEGLSILGYTAIYDDESLFTTFKGWDLALRNRATVETWRNMFDNVDACMGLPVYVFWEQIFEAFPDAKVILLVRDEDEWWASVRSSIGALEIDGRGSFLTSNDFVKWIERCTMPSYHQLANVLRFATSAVLGASRLSLSSLNERVARTNFRKHNLYVQSRFTGALSSQLLVYNVSEGWGPLCSFLGRAVPSEIAFPKVPVPMMLPGSDGSTTSWSETAREAERASFFATHISEHADSEHQGRGADCCSWYRTDASVEDLQAPRCVRRRHVLKKKTLLGVRMRGGAQEGLSVATRMTQPTSCSPVRRAR